MHNRVSSMTEVKCMEAGFTLARAPLSPFEEDEGVLSLSFDDAPQGTCREVRSTSSMI